MHTVSEVSEDVICAIHFIQCGKSEVDIKS